jgi:hypothetical protein
VVIKSHHPFLEMGVKTGFEIYGAYSITMIFATIKIMGFSRIIP